MKISWPAFLSPPQFPSYERTQRAKILHYMLVASFFGALTFGIMNFLNGWYNEATYLFVFAGISVIGFILNLARYSRCVGLVLIISLFLVICLLLYNGTGLYDETVLIFPGFIISATFLFGKRGLWISTIASVAVVVGMYYLHEHGYYINKFPVSPTRTFNLATLILFIALGIWAIRDSWEMNLRHLRESYDLTLQGWARALEYRDGETAGHTRRVTELSVRLARKLGCSEEEIQGIERGAYLHDIGKMTIPDSILLKPGKLTEEESEIMKQHPVRAVEFISEIPYLQPAIEMVYSHHEHWDGSGYPEGLHGEEIPLAARIFTVADNWDALNSDRPYRKAWPSEDVVAYLQGYAGSIFDPKIVEAFLEILREDKS